MTLDLLDAAKLTDQELLALPEAERIRLFQEGLSFLEEDRRQFQLLYYKPANPEAEKFHLSSAKTRGIFGGNGSSKSETMFVETIIQATGIIPFSLRGKYDKRKIRCPAHYRIIQESNTTTLYPVILPKFQWWHWTSETDPPGGPRGHWGWIPKSFLIGGDWQKSWSDKTKILRLRCGCYVQFMSHDQDATDFASGSPFVCAHDELTKPAIWRENLARTMRSGGYMYVAMTPPDEAGISVDWIYDKVYEPGMRMDNPDIHAFHLFTENNPHLDQQAVAKRAQDLSPAVREVRLHGRFIHMSNRIHPLFTDHPQTWCFKCHSRLVALIGDTCPECGSDDLLPFCHASEEEEEQLKRWWPVVFLIDPHPRRPHAMAWITVTPEDDAVQVAELEVDGSPSDVEKAVFHLEQQWNLHVVRRLMDPNMGESPASAKDRRKTWREEFDEAGLRCDTHVLDDFTIGKNRINDMLKPDPFTRRPRARVMKDRCPKTIFQFNRYVWGEWGRYTADERDAKERPKDKHGDFPALWRYFANSNFTFRQLQQGAEILHTRRKSATQKPRDTLAEKERMLGRRL